MLQKGEKPIYIFCEEPPFLVPNGLNIGEQKIYKQGGYFIYGSSMKKEVAYIVWAWVGAMYLERGNTRKNFIGIPPLFVNVLFSNVQTIGHQKGWFFKKKIYRFLPLLEHSHLPKLTNYMSLPHSLFSITVITWYY